MGAELKQCDADKCDANENGKCLVFLKGDRCDKKGYYNTG